MTYYKVLRDGKSCNGGTAEWSLPIRNPDGTWMPGGWMPVIKGKLVACVKGYHICKDSHVIKWLDTEIYAVEYEGKIFEYPDKCVARKCRLLRKYEKWDERTQRLFACDCAENVLRFYVDKYPDDKRPREAIETARRYANGNATKEELTVVRDAARAARDAAWVLWAAAGAASRAARDAARAAGDAAWVSRAAAGASWAAAGASRAARDAAWAWVSWDVAGASRASGDAELEWQYTKLLDYIGGCQ